MRDLGGWGMRDWAAMGRRGSFCLRGKKSAAVTSMIGRGEPWYCPWTPNTSLRDGPGLQVNGNVMSCAQGPGRREKVSQDLPERTGSRNSRLGGRFVASVTHILYVAGSSSSTCCCYNSVRVSPRCKHRHTCIQPGCRGNIEPMSPRGSGSFQVPPHSSRTSQLEKLERAPGSHFSKSRDPSLLSPG